MSPSDVAGVFSRYFIVGFFLPAFFVIMGLSQSLSTGFLPESFENLSGGAQVLVVGGAGLLLGLLLLGLNWQIFRAFEGYPLAGSGRIRGAFRDFLVRRKRRTFQALISARDGNDAAHQTSAAWRLDREFPPTEEQILPTHFGNAVLAFESHAMTRWGLDSVAVWPRIEMLLSDREAEQHANARAEAALFVNFSLLLGVAGLFLLADQFSNSPLHDWALVAYSIPFVGAALAGHWAKGAATRWGSCVRSAIDLHRFELYERLGVRRPRDFTDERESIAPSINHALLYGSALPDDRYAAAAAPASAQGKGATP